MSGRVTLRRAGIGLVGLLLWAWPAAAQENQATLEASFVRGVLGYARAIGPSSLAGVEVGFGLPQLDRTLAPEQDATGSPEFEEYLHIGVLLRSTAAEHVDVDVGLRASIGDLWPCGASDCWPQPFVGAYVQPMVGWRRLKFGPRLVAGWIFESERRSEGSTWVVGLSPFAARYALSW